MQEVLKIQSAGISQSSINQTREDKGIKFFLFFFVMRLSAHGRDEFSVVF